MNGRLYRSTNDRVLAGVAGGMAETYGMDPAIVRVGWALLTLLTGGLLLVLYIVMALVVPLRQFDAPPYQAASAAGGPEWPTQTGSDLPPQPAMGASQAHPWHPPERRPGDSTAPLVFGAILILVGGFFLLREFIPAVNLALFWPVLIIVGGVLLIGSAMRRGQ